MARAYSDEFADSFFEALLWSSTDNSRDDGGDPLDKNYGPKDIAEPVWNALVEECGRFEEDMDAQIASWPGARGRNPDRHGAAGHDFALTRNHHGAGFWDGDWPEPAATELTNESHTYPQVDLYVGDDGQIWASGYESGARRVREYRTLAQEEDESAGYDIDLDGLRGLGSSPNNPGFQINDRYILDAENYGDRFLVWVDEDQPDSDDEAGIEAAQNEDYFNVSLWRDTGEETPDADGVPSWQIVDGIGGMGGYGGAMAAACAAVTDYFTDHLTPEQVAEYQQQLCSRRFLKDRQEHEVDVSTGYEIELDGLGSSNDPSGEILFQQEVLDGGYLLEATEGEAPGTYDLVLYGEDTADDGTKRWEWIEGEGGVKAPSPKAALCTAIRNGYFAEWAVRGKRGNSDNEKQILKELGCSRVAYGSKLHEPDDSSGYNIALDGLGTTRHRTYDILLDPARRKPIDPKDPGSGRSLRKRGLVYYSVIIPPSSEPTPWHDPDGIQTLSRGMFDTPEIAHRWAARHLEGQPYEVRMYDKADEGEGAYDIELAGLGAQGQDFFKWRGHERQVKLVIGTDSARVDEPKLPRLPRNGATPEQLRAWLAVADPEQDYRKLPVALLWDAIEHVLLENGYLRDDTRIVPLDGVRRAR